MNRTLIGNYFEDEARKKMIKEGYKIIEHSSELKWGSPYDFIVSKNKEKYYVEVKGSNSNFFSLGKAKINTLEKYKNVIILFINNDGYKIIELNELLNNPQRYFINNKKIGFKLNVRNKNLIEEAVIYYTKKYAHGATVRDVMRRVDLCRQTIINILSELNKEGKLEVSNCGMTKLYHWKGNENK